MHLGGKCVLFREVVSLVQGCSGLHTVLMHLPHVVSLHCRTPSITKKSSSFRDAYTSDKDVLRGGEVEREGERRDSEEKGNRKWEGRKTDLFDKVPTNTRNDCKYIWNLSQFMSGWIQ